MNSTKLTRTLTLCCKMVLALFWLAAGEVLAQGGNFNGGAVSGCTYTASSQSYSCAALPLANYNDSIAIASGYTVVVSSTIDFGYNHALQMSGTAKLQSSGGNLDIGDINPSNLQISGGSLVASGNFKIGAQAQTITANVTAGSLSIGSGSTTKITGSLTTTGTATLASHVTIVGPITATTITTGSPVNLTGNITASNSFQLSSGSYVVGNISAPQVTIDPASSTVTGNIVASTKIEVGSGSKLTGDITGGDMKINPSSVVVTGNVTMSGKLEMGSGDTITGNVAANEVKMNDSSGYIGGNARITNKIEIGYAGRVGKTITCVNGSGCSCVVNNSGYNSAPNAPVCGAAAASGPDHILITHGGTGLTCQPQSVTLTACADSACSSTYSGSVTGTLQPGGASFTINGTGSGTVAQSTAGSATLSATSSSVTNSSTCQRTSDSSSSCSMSFATAGLDFAVPDHLSETATGFTLRALKQGTASTACVAALANTTQTVTFNCGYVNPSTANPSYPSPLRLNGTALGSSANAACSAGGASVSLAFDANGQATPTLLYDDVGQVSLNASMTLAGAGTLTGSDSFIVAPAKFLFTIKKGSLTNPAAADASGAVFIGAGQTFTATLAAVNAINGTTYNFGRESSPEGFSIRQSLVAPAGGVNPGVSASFDAMTNGSTTKDMYFNEVGIFNFTANLLNTSGYLGAGAANFSTTGSINVGRFIPDHFNTALSSTLLMNCISVTGVSKPCPAPNASGTFLYARQPFDSSVTAYNANNGITANYTGAFAKAITLSAWNAAGTNLPADQNPPVTPSGNNIVWKTTAGAAPLAAANGIAAADFSAGVANSATRSSDGHPEYDFANIYPAANSLIAAPVSLYLRALDTDGASSLRTPQAGEAIVSMVSGRLLVDNAYGALTSGMPVRVRAQFWNGSAYIANPAYNNSAGVALTGKVSFSNCTPKGGSSGACGSTPAILSGAVLSFSGGQGSFNVTPLTAAGSADVAVNPLVYLPSTTGRATFGVYRAGPVVYLREVF
ncbi:MAG: DUF6701 domain-containing protein [Sphingomonadaceae bacterium]